MRVGEKYGYIDKTGKIILKPQFDFAGRFSDGLALIRVGSEYGYIDRSGEFIIKPQYLRASPFSEGLAVVGTGPGSTYINREGIMVMEVNGNCGPFSDGMAVIRIQDKLGYIDKSGKTVIKPAFVWVEGFRGGLAKVHSGNMSEYAYIDRAGNYIWRSSK